MTDRFKTLMLDPKDHVAMALEFIPSGAVVQVTCQDFSQKIKLKDDIGFGHKFAVRPMMKGQDVLKYGEVIGSASADIEVGMHVHVHNLEGKRGRGDQVVRNQGMEADGISPS